MIITEKQINFIISLRRERALPQQDADEMRGMARDAASKEISRLLAMPKVGVAAKAEFVAVPEGHFAVEYEGVLRFYRVKKATKGRWAGRTFVNRLSSENYVMISRAESDAARVLIDAAPQAAAERYAREIGRCYACNRQLTDAESRRLGIGPECRRNGRGF